MFIFFFTLKIPQIYGGCHPGERGGVTVVSGSFFALMLIFWKSGENDEV